jgi:hypothetical protein
MLHEMSYDALDDRMFYFFRTYTADSISGDFKGDIWGKNVLQLYHSEQAVRSAVHAVAALHEMRITRSTITSPPTAAKAAYPLRQYVKALDSLQMLLASNNPHIDLVLVCALLCVHFEIIRESFSSALIHINSVTGLLHNSRKLLINTADPNIIACVIHIDVLGSMFVGSRTPKLQHREGMDAGCALPEMFCNIAQARKSTDMWTCRVYEFLRATADSYKFKEPGNVPIDLIWTCHQLGMILVRLLALVETLQREGVAHFDVYDHNAIGLLRMQLKANQILVATCLYSEESIYDVFLDDFEMITTICSSVTVTQKTDQWLSSIALEGWIFHPLQLVASHCRDSIVRHKALKQMEARCVVSQAWYTEAITQMVKRCVEFEEASCHQSDPKCSDIPERSRIHSCGFQIHKQEASRQLTVSFTSRPNGMDGEWHEWEEIITW